jgi:glycosyltransferase involved in cell wall biosynthesis
MPRPRLLFVAMPESIHAVRWIRQLNDEGWDIHLFPCYLNHIHEEFRDITIHDFEIRRRGIDRSIRLSGALPWPFAGGDRLAGYALRLLRRSRRLAPWRADQAGRLAALIRQIKPDLVHSLEFQHSGYLTSEAKDRSEGLFPPWIATNWGSDIFLFGRIREHKDKICRVLASCDYYSCECHRDVELARRYGFSGEALPVLPNTGGLDLEKIRQMREPGPTSERRLVLLKGYQGWAGRALVGIRALSLCADALQGYRVAIYLASPDVHLAAELFSESTGVPCTIVPYVPHEEILRLHGQARVSIGLSIGDAISTSMLEAMAMGSFPIQSNTACTGEWVQDGVSALVVPPEDPDVIAAAIRRALADDALVDEAARINSQVVTDRLDQKNVRRQVVEMYRSILARNRGYDETRPDASVRHR